MGPTGCTSFRLKTSGDTEYRDIAPIKTNGISMVCPVLNEERFIEGWCHNALSLFNEVIVADMGCTDRTMDIVREFSSIRILRGPKYEPYQWNEAIVRNWLTSLCSHQWVMEGGADELYGDVMKDRLLELTNRPESFISFNVLDFFYTVQTIRRARWCDGVMAYRRRNFTNRVRMYRRSPDVSYRDIGEEKPGKHTYLQYQGLGRGSQRLSLFHSHIPVFHYHHVFPSKRKHDDWNDDGVLLESYFGPHPHGVEWFPWWKRRPMIKQ